MKKGHDGHHEGFGHNHATLKKAGHHGLMKHKGSKGGHLVTTPSNVKALGSKAGK